jgi:HlyD family secretion protein
MNAHGHRPRQHRRLWKILFFVTLALGGFFVVREGLNPAARRKLPDDLRTATAQQADLHVTLTAPGRIQSSKQTLIEAEIENLTFYSDGRTLSAGSTSTIIDLIPEGSFVKQGDVLCRIDSSGYEELVRQQEIKVEQARADYRKSELDLGAAEVALQEYKDGLFVQQHELMQGQVLLAESEVKRQTDRLDWSTKQFDKGYLSAGQVAADRFAHLRAIVNLGKLQGELNKLERFSGPVNIRLLESRIVSLKSTLDYMFLRRQRQEEQLERFKKQVERCTVRAPHDGFVIYANDDDDDPRIQLGGRVYYKMDLFYLPDLADMEVLTTLHESIVQRVSPGMTAQVRVEALPRQRIEGEVASILPLPETPSGRRFNSDVKNFLGRVKLHSVPAKLRPGMTAEVEIVTAQRSNAVIVPSEALAVENGQGVIYVHNPERGIERRIVPFAQATEDTLEIREGLAAGENVVLDPDRVDPELVCGTTFTTSEPPASVSFQADPASTRPHVPLMTAASDESLSSDSN